MIADLYHELAEDRARTGSARNEPFPAVFVRMLSAVQHGAFSLLFQLTTNLYNFLL
jgi:hypothetical protein